MENIENVTQFVAKKIVRTGGNPDREIFAVIKTNNGQSCYKYDDKNYFRMYKFITDTVTIENEKTNKILFNAGRGFGHFQNLLDDFLVEKLNETIVDLHNTPKRIQALKKSIKKDVCKGRNIFCTVTR